MPRPHRAQGPGARLAAVAMLDALDLGHQHRDALGRTGDERRQRLARLAELARIDRGAVVTRATAAALRNDYAEARREIASLDAADRAPAQAWLDKAAAREAALAASRQFAEETMAALAKSAQ